MLTINTQTIQKETLSFENLINKYESIYLDLFKELDMTKESWQDNLSLQFNEKIYLEKLDTNKLINQFKDIADIYQYIYESYKKIGKKIAYNLEAKDKILNQITYNIEELTKVCEEYNNINFSFYYPERNSILNQRQKIITMLNSSKNIKQQCKTFYSNIEKIEQEIHQRLEKLENIVIKDFELFK